MRKRGFRSIVRCVLAAACTLVLTALMCPLTPAAASVSGGSCEGQCNENYEGAAAVCGKMNDEGQRRACQDSAYASYKSCRANCQHNNGACEKRCDDEAEACERECRKIPEDDKKARRRCWNDCNEAHGRCRKKC
jgi:hypothetical protein